MNISRFLSLQYRIEAGVTTVAYAATAVSLLADVIGREMFGGGVWGAPRFAVYSAIIAGFLGMSLAAADGRHVRPQFMDFVFPEKFDAYVNRVADFISACLYFVLAYFACKFVLVSYENGDIAPVLDWVLWPIQTVLPYTFFSVAFRYLMKTINPAMGANYPLNRGVQ